MVIAGLIGFIAMTEFRGGRTPALAELALLRMVVGVAPRQERGGDAHVREVHRQARRGVVRLWQCSIQSPGLSARNASS